MTTITTHQAVVMARLRDCNGDAWWSALEMGTTDVTMRALERRGFIEGGLGSTPFIRRGREFAPKCSVYREVTS